MLDIVVVLQLTSLAGLKYVVILISITVPQ